MLNNILVSVGGRYHQDYSLRPGVHLSGQSLINGQKLTQIDFQKQLMTSALVEFQV